MSLPLLLAGPILRRCESHRVLIWLATSRDVKAQAKIYTAQDDASIKSGQPLGQESLRCIGTSAPEEERPESVQLGDHLWVTLLAVRPSDGQFPKDRLLFYDLDMGGENLSDLKLLDSEKGIIYPGMPLPCFFLPLRLVSFFHGSCRKPHGLYEKPELFRKPLAGEIDSLAAADAEIVNTATKVDKRPAALFLTGDQIYADDVAGPLMCPLTALGEALTGWREEIPKLRTNPAQIPLYGRKALLADVKSGLTSGHAENHLLTFGEYAAMYILAFNGDADLWPTQKPQAELAPEHVAQYEKEWLVVAGFRDTIHKARRVLANTPTYMIFDDHEITDDWNLHRKWYSDVWGSPAGRRIVSNGLAAYWAFQGWGNSPEAFSPRLISAMSEHLTAKATEGNKAKRFDQRLWSFHRWAYALDTDPPVIVVDSRTQREYDSFEGPPRLIDRYGIDWIRIAWSDLGEPHEKGLILVTSTPVYGFEPLEKLQKVASTIVPLGAEKFDRESWIANREGFSSLMRVLNTEVCPKWCLILSGDVHYAFSTRAKFLSDKDSLQVIQLTSSALNNMPKETKYLKGFGRVAERTEHRLGWLPGTGKAFRLLKPAIEFFVRFGWLKPKKERQYFWTDEVIGVPPEGESSLIYPYNNIGLVRLKENGSLEHCLFTGNSVKPKVEFLVHHID